MLHNQQKSLEGREGEKRTDSMSDIRRFCVTPEPFLRLLGDFGVPNSCTRRQGYHLDGVVSKYERKTARRYGYKTVDASKRSH
jgi:hypothetical protein